MHHKVLEILESQNDYANSRNRRVNVHELIIKMAEDRRNLPANKYY